MHKRAGFAHRKENCRTCSPETYKSSRYRRIIPFEELAKMVGFIWSFCGDFGFYYPVKSMESLQESCQKYHDGYEKFSDYMNAYLA